MRTTMAARKRPRRSNSPLDIARGIKTLKTIYSTKSKLRKLLPGAFSPGREEHFARAMLALREWRELSREQIIEATSRINPRRLMGGRWAWPDPLPELQKYAALRRMPSIPTSCVRHLRAWIEERSSALWSLLWRGWKNCLPRRDRD
jgi:hypothetical protein